MAQIYNKIVVVAEDQTIPDYPVQTAKFEFWLIEGPHRKSLDTTRETRELIKQKVLGLTKR